MDFQNQLAKNSNLTNQEHQALLSLCNNKDIIILPADKGSMAVVMNRQDYIIEAERQLSDTQTYIQGYPKALVCSKIAGPRHQQEQTSSLWSLTTYYHGLHKLNNLLKTGFLILQSSTATQHIFKEPPKRKYCTGSTLYILLHMQQKHDTECKRDYESGGHGNEVCGEHSAHKTFRIKQKLAKKLKQNRPIPQWVRMRTDNTISFVYISRFIFLISWRTFK
uniref:Large ribosomal subunit protein eL39 n=1 Tax=Timema cristinae TaxID=61476 RepID=A0A7R9GR83_TIMCR|nr:unnamed protein product [Timema cristinae]